MDLIQLRDAQVSTAVLPASAWFFPVWFDADRQGGEHCEFENGWRAMHGAFWFRRTNFLRQRGAVLVQPIDASDVAWDL